MRVMLDLNIVFDLVQVREAHLEEAAEIVKRALAAEYEACVPAHCLTTVFYVVERSADRAAAGKAVDWILDHLRIVPTGLAEFRYARSLQIADFEDAVVAAAAEVADCDWIISRNVQDFAGSPVRALTPGDFLRIPGAP